MDTTTDGKATRDPNDPFRRVRGDDEARLERIVLRDLHAQLREIMDRLGDPPDPNALDYAFWEGLQNTMIADVRPEMERMALHLARGEAKALATKAEPVLPAGIPILWEEEVIFREAADWARAYTYDLIHGIVENTREDVRRGVSAFVETPGRTIGQLRDELTPLFTQSRAQRIAVTETTRAYAEGTRMVQEEIGRAGIRMEQVWRTAMDDKVCPICGPNANKRKSEGWTVAGVPAHPNCRCWTTLALPEMVGAQVGQQGARIPYAPDADRIQMAEAAGRRAMADTADYLGLSEQEVAARIRQSLTESGLLDQPIEIRSGVDAAMQIADDGRFKSQFETRSSGGQFAPDWRASSERRLLGVPEDISDALRPIYGAIDPANLGYDDNAAHYGNVKWVLKDDVKNRTTLTWGDSLEVAQFDDAVAVPWNQFATNPAAWTDSYMQEQLAALTPSREWEVKYVEAQIHGGVRLSDVDHVLWDEHTGYGWMPGDPVGDTYGWAEQLYKKLIGAGIRVVTG